MYLPKPDAGGDFEPLAAGTHTAICYRVIDLGSQDSTFKGKTTRKHKIMISWEIPDERMNDGRPFTASKRYTWSMHQKAMLRKDLESWRGAPFQDADFGHGGFNVKNLLGKACTLVVSHTEEGDRTYTNVDGVGPKMKGLPNPQQTNENVYLSLDPQEFDPDTYRRLPDRIQEIIAKSPEFAEAVGGPAQHPYAGRNSHDIVDDDIPF